MVKHKQLRGLAVCPHYRITVEPFNDGGGFDVMARVGRELVGWLSVSGTQVMSSNVYGGHRRCGIGTKLYTAAAKHACAAGVGLESDEARSGFAQSFWEKQVRKGRARCTKEVTAPEGDFAQSDIVLRRGGCKTFKLACPVTDLSGRRRR